MFFRIFRKMWKITPFSAFVLEEMELNKKSETTETSIFLVLETKITTILAEEQRASQHP